MANAQVHIGVDVSKDTLDVFIPDGKTLRIRNTLSGVRKLVRGVKAKDPSAMFCCESTGGYERTLLDVCREEGQPVCLMNALQVRRYVEHRGMLEKTDRIAARIISMAADDKRPAPYVHSTTTTCYSFVHPSIISKKNRLLSPSRKQLPSEREKCYFI